MRCKSCDVLLESHELKRRDKETKEFIDLCNVCFKVSTLAMHTELDTSTNDADEVNLSDYIDIAEGTNRPKTL